MTSSNGLFQNGLTTNGVYQNGVYQNGVYQNGVYQNGVYQNGVYQNGVYQNGVYQNGVYQNGLGWTSGLWANQTWLTGTNADAMRNNPYTRQFFQYVYACAFPPGVDTTLDPNDGTLACAADGSCASGYSCSAQHTCVVPLAGVIGVGVNADGSTWASSGRCDESCQRWVSACVLARTNAYGVHVDISMRAPDDAPAAVKAALAVSDTERAAYSLREGAYYGNVFASTPTTAPPSPDYSGPITGQIVATPSFYACAGPGSNIPEITKRFCSSQGDQAVIAVPGVCLPVGQEKPVCSGEDSDPASPTFGAIHDCYRSSDWSGLTPYKEVITVYLKQPISVCGNGVCEAGEDAAGTSAYCPSDCHIDTWAQSTAGTGTLDGASFAAFDPIDGSSYVNLGDIADPTVVDNTVAPPVVVAGTQADQAVLVKYTPDGKLAWTKRYDLCTNETIGNGFLGYQSIAVGPDHNVVLVEVLNRTVCVLKIDPNGVLLGNYNVGAVAGSASGISVGSIRIDATGNIYLVGHYFGMVSPLATLTLGTLSITASIDQYNMFAAKLSPTGQALWLTDVYDLRGQYDQGLAIDGNGDALALMPNNLFKLDGATGAIKNTSAVLSVPYGVASDPGDPQHAVYVTGSHFVMKLTSDLQTTLWSQYIDGQPHGVTVDGSGNIVVITDFWGSPNDFGAGSFQPYHADHLAVVAYSSAGAFLWAKQIPTILGSRYGWAAGLASPGGADDPFPNVTVDARGHVNVTGGFAGSMQLDDRMLVSVSPETVRGNTFVGSFVEPPATDKTPPVIGQANDQTGVQLSTVPSTITVEATSAQGAQVFFMPPTAIDAAHAGSNVTCSPAPNTTFRIGTTTVTCIATDPVGNSSSAQFHVIVQDTLAPILSNLPADVTSATRIVHYAAPTAFDQVDGSVPVTCTPASGASFPGGTSTVTCSASDQRGHTIGASFHVTVPDVTPPVISVPSALAVEATGPGGAIVTYTSSATDDLDGAVAVACTPASGALFPLGATKIGCTAHDSAGNVATASFIVTVSDTTPPQLTLPATIAAAATSASGAVVTYTTSASDIVDGPIAPSCAPASGAQFAAGTTTVSCSATDAHGNRATGSFQVVVAFAWSGVLQPINADGSSIFKLGSTVPVKFQLTGASAGIADLVATLQIAKISNRITGDYVEASSNGAADSGNTFRYDSTSQTYIFNLSTKSLSAGTWSLQIVMPDGVARMMDISLR